MNSGSYRLCVLHVKLSSVFRMNLWSVFFKKICIAFYLLNLSNIRAKTSWHGFKKGKLAGKLFLFACLSVFRCCLAQFGSPQLWFIAKTWEPLCDRLMIHPYAVWVYRRAGKGVDELWNRQQITSDHKSFNNYVSPHGYTFNNWFLWFLGVIRNKGLYSGFIRSLFDENNCCLWPKTTL